MFSIPYFMPGWSAGAQIQNPGTGGPASHPLESATKPQIWPTAYAVGCYGLGAMPRQVLGPTPVIQPTPTMQPPQGLLISGLQKQRG